MPFCTHCGNEVTVTDQFCARCGGPQKGQERPQQPGGGAGPGAGTGAAPGVELKGILDRMTPRKASMLCYIPVLGWVPSIIVLASTRFQNDREVRFHAFQGLYLFVAWLMVDWVVGPMFRGLDFHIEGLLKTVIFAAWVFMIVKTSQNEHYRLPVFGELAERSVSEQR